MNQTAPKSLRLQIALFGKVNAGKSSFLNLVAGQQVSITSPIAGTTTDAVEKAMELLPLGPVLFIDCAGYGDETALGAERMKKSDLAYSRADVIVWLTNASDFGDIDRRFLRKCSDDKRKVMVVFNKIACRRTGTFDKKRDLIVKNMTEHLTIVCFHGMIMANPKTSATHRGCEFLNEGENHNEIHSDQSMCFRTGNHDVCCFLRSLRFRRSAC